MSNTDDDSGKVIQFPTTAEERRAIHRARQEAERQRLVDLFVDEASGQALFLTPDNECFADLVIMGVRQTLEIRSLKFRAEYVRHLRRQFENPGAPTAVTIGAARVALKESSVKAAITDFELRALSSSIVHDVHVRVARDGDHLYVDLGDPEWRAVRITGDGWSVVESPPVRFRRPPDMRPLPFPEHGGSIEPLRQFLPGVDDDAFILIVAFLLAALQPNGPYPVLVFYGQQGWAKTGLLRILRALTDPNKVMTAPLPSGVRDLRIAASNSHMQAFENVSKIPDAMSDNLCRLATGGGFRTRALYSNANEATFAGARPIMMEGIAAFVTKPDLIDRSIIIPLEGTFGRMTERDLWAKFDKIKGGVFGALLDMMVKGVKRLPETRLVDLPRMADFAVWVTACGLDGFETAYARNRQGATDAMLEHDLLAQAVEAFMATWREWRGAASDLLQEIGHVAGCLKPRELGDGLRRLAPPLRTHGITVVEEKRSSRQRPIVITRIEPTDA
jgi:hypothetical protein